MKSWIPGVVGLGILLLLIGAAYYHGNYYGEQDPDAAKTAVWIKDIGIFLAAIGLALGGLIDTEEDKFVRFGMLLAAAIIIGLLWGSLISYGYS